MACLTMILTFPLVKIWVVLSSRIVIVSVGIVNIRLPLKTYSIYLILILVENFFKFQNSRIIFNHIFIRLTNYAHGKNFSFLGGL